MEPESITTAIHLLGTSMTERPDMNHTMVKRAVKCKSYTIDPDQVATALIVKLVQETLDAQPPARSGPNQSNGAAGHLRRAA